MSCLADQLFKMLKQRTFLQKSFKIILQIHKLTLSSACLKFVHNRNTTGKVNVNKIQHNKYSNKRERMKWSLLYENAMSPSEEELKAVLS